MRTFGLVGKSLLHSFSQQYFAEKFLQNSVLDAEYQLFSLKNIDEIQELLKHPILLGFNVTIPYKTEIIPFLDGLDVVAQEIDAVNCVVKENGRWIGYNTDVIGFEKTLQEVQDLLTDDFSHRTSALALVLGSGGASKAVAYVLKQRNIPFQMVSRNKTEETITYNDITEEIINHHTFIINTTPLGMFPNTDEMPQIPYSALNSNHVLIDLIYNPKETLFLKEGKKHGTFTMNGLTMLKTQAEASWKLFKM
jgi:shikimate dehydrogenase